MSASQLFQIERAKLPQHTMHVHGRMVVMLYLAKRYKTFPKHKARISRALHNLDNAK